MSWLFLSFRMSTSATFRATPVTIFTLLISADAIVNQTAKAAFLTAILAGMTFLLPVIYNTFSTFRAKI